MANIIMQTLLQTGYETIFTRQTNKCQLITKLYTHTITSMKQYPIWSQPFLQCSPKMFKSCSTPKREKIIAFCCLLIQQIILTLVFVLFDRYCFTDKISTLPLITDTACIQSNQKEKRCILVNTQNRHKMLKSWHFKHINPSKYRKQGFGQVKVRLFINYVLIIDFYF